MHVDMLTVLSLLLFSPLRCSALQALLESNMHQSNFLVSPHLSSNRYHHSQPVMSDSCKGILPNRCVCQPEVSDLFGGPGTLPVESVSCINSRMTDTDELLALQTFPNVQSATFYGNNFVEFTDRILGSGKQKTLQYLNLSNNNVLYLNQDAFVGMPSLQSLDLSENALYLREGTSDWAFLRPLRFLRRLLLRRAFRRPLVNGSAQLALLERGLRLARLQDLQFLDLSENDIEQFPPSLICATPGLTNLVLASNRLRTLHFTKNCNIELKALDLRWNRIKYFDHGFMRAARYFGPISVQIADNPLDCSCSTCESMNSMTWFRSTTVIKDKETIRCQAAESGSDSDDGEYRSDNYMLYAPLRPAMHCLDKPASASQERDSVPESGDSKSTRKPPTKPRPREQTNTASDTNSVVQLLVGGDNETFVNNSALVLAPLRLLPGSFVRRMISAPEHIAPASPFCPIGLLFMLLDTIPVLELCAIVLAAVLAVNLILAPT